MKCGVVRLSQIRETGRMDAAFNIEFAQRRNEVAAVIARHTREEIRAFIHTIGYDETAWGTVYKSNSIRPSAHTFDNAQWMNYALAEIALYCVIAKESLLDQIRKLDYKVKAFRKFTGDNCEAETV